MALILPDINGSSGIWGTILNDALNGMDVRITDNTNAASTNTGAIATNTTAINGLNTRVTTIEGAAGSATPGMKAFTSVANRDATIPNPTPGMQCITTDTNVQWVGVTITGTSKWVPVPGQMLGSLWQNTPQNIPDSTTGTVINFSTPDITYNPLNWLDPTANQFKPTAPGWYELSGGVSFEMGTGTATTTGIRLCYFRLNGSGSLPGTAGSPTLNALTGTVLSLSSATYYLNGVSDYIELLAAQNSGQALATMTGQGYQRPRLSAKYVAAPH
jgi:hypothetical protein